MKSFFFVSIQPKPKDGLEVELWLQTALHVFCLNSAEAEEWFRSFGAERSFWLRQCFNSAEAEGWFRSWQCCWFRSWCTEVSIQPKPKDGLEAGVKKRWICYQNRFNSAEAEGWFRSFLLKTLKKMSSDVSIQPKPKDGLEVLFKITEVDIK